MEKKKKGFFSRIGGWLKRNIFGGSKVLADDLDKRIDVEEVVSPMKQIWRGFLERKSAVVAALIVIAMFLLVFVGPLFMPKYYDAYTEITQKNVAPNMSMMKVPSELDGHIKQISSYGAFSVGLSDSGKVYVWGATQLGTTGIDIGKIPAKVQNDKIVMVTAGIDHIIAISEEGTVYGWGSNRHGQFITTDAEVLEAQEEGDEIEEETLPILDAETEEVEGEEAENEEAEGEDVEAIEDESEEKDNKNAEENIIPMPAKLVYGKIDVENIQKLTSGYQCSAILMKDGTLYIWGNKNAYQNIEFFTGKDDLVDIEFTLNYVVGLTKDRNAVFTGKRGLYDKYRANINGTAVKAKEFLDGRKIQSIHATSSTVCGMLDDGSLFFTGNFPSRSDPMPKLHDGEEFVQLQTGAYHYSGITTEGRVLSWGGNTLNQTSVPKNVKAKDGDTLFACSFQNYLVSKDGEVSTKWGLKGYLFGSDKYGADILQRIIQGGKMTMTIGAVAVIISTVIGIIIGCVSGYFGGKVDLILMRIEEIFAAIPFLPFALILSALMAQMDITENQKIMLLMVILGLLTWTGLARMVRGQVLVARENEYVTAAKAMGVKEFRIAFKHILPNVVSIIFVTLTLDFATCMLTESELSYLGFGVTYPRPTWGNMLNGANNATIIKNYWWQWLFTSLFLSITCICINIVGDTLRDVMDPKSDRDK